MKIKGIEVEDFVNYKYPSMFLAIGSCDWKCCIEGGFDISVCHNSPLAHAKEYEVDCEFLYNEYIDSKACFLIFSFELFAYLPYNSSVIVGLEADEYEYGI